AGGDDYELAFTAPAASRQAVESAAAQSRTVVTRIGSIESTPGLRLLDAHGQILKQTFLSFDHFAQGQAQ
ncbi:MAG: thiamine-phosphate kinase, partial [Pseudomonadota bacterium]